MHRRGSRLVYEKASPPIALSLHVTQLFTLLTRTHTRCRSPPTLADTCMTFSHRFARPQMRKEAEVRRGEERLLAAESRFTEERLSASKIQMQWAVDKEDAERSKAEAAIRQVENEKNELEAKLEKALHEVQGWRKKAALADSMSAKADQSRQMAEELQAGAEARVSAAMASLHEAEDETARETSARVGSDIAIRALASTVDDMQAELQALRAAHAKQSAQLARAKATANLTVPGSGSVSGSSSTQVETAGGAAKNDPRLMLLMEELAKAQKAIQDLEAKRAEVEEQVKDMKRMRTRELAKAAKDAKKEAAKEAEKAAAKEAERVEVQTRRQVLDAQRKVEEAMKETFKAREVDIRRAVETEANERVRLAEEEKDGAVASVLAQSQEKEEILREEWRAELTRAMEEKQLLQRELQRFDERPHAVAAMKGAHSSFASRSAARMVLRALSHLPQSPSSRARMCLVSSDTVKHHVWPSTRPHKLTSRSRSLVYAIPDHSCRQRRGGSLTTRWKRRDAPTFSA